MLRDNNQSRLFMVDLSDCCQSNDRRENEKEEEEREEKEEKKR